VSAVLLDDILLLAIKFRELALHLVALRRPTFELCRLEAIAWAESVSRMPVAKNATGMQSSTRLSDS
jgi:hypothetical protein